MRQHYNTLLVKMLEKNSATLKPTFPLEIPLVGITTQGVSLLPYELRSFTLFSFCKYIPSPFLFAFAAKASFRFRQLLILWDFTSQSHLHGVILFPLHIYIYIFINKCMHYTSYVTHFNER